MNIDFFTLAAQIINLLILLFLLRKFLYVPVLNIVTKRQQEMLANQEQIVKQQEILTQKQEQLRQEEANIGRQKQKILAQIRKDSEVLTQRLKISAKQEYLQAQEKWKNTLMLQQKDLELGVQNLVSKYFQSYSLSAFKQLANTDLNEMIMQKFLHQVTSLPAQKRRKIAQEFQNQKLINVKTAEKLSASQKQNLVTFLQKEFALPDKTKIKFEIDKHLICGISVLAKDALIEWNLAHFTAEFNKKLNHDISNLIYKG